MKVDNYTSVLTREEKIYTLGNVNITSTGIGVTTIKFTILGVFLGFLLGALISLVLGTWIFWGENFSMTWASIFLMCGGFFGYYLYKGRIGPYPVYKYLIAYFTPKKVYNAIQINQGPTYKMEKLDVTVRRIL